MFRRFGLGFAVGYVFGARAGEKRYEEMTDLAHRVLDNPAAAQVTERVRGVATMDAGRRLVGGLRDRVTGTGDEADGDGKGSRGRSSRQDEAEDYDRSEDYDDDISDEDMSDEEFDDDDFEDDQMADEDGGDGYDDVRADRSGRAPEEEDELVDDDSPSMSDEDQVDEEQADEGQADEDQAEEPQGRDRGRRSGRDGADSRDQAPAAGGRRREAGSERSRPARRREAGESRSRSRVGTLAAAARERGRVD